MVYQETAPPRVVKKAPKLPNFAPPSALMAKNCWQNLCDSYPALSALNIENGAVAILADTIARNGAVKVDMNGVPPPASAVRAYIAEIGADFSAEDFCDYYAVRDWKVSAGKAAFRMTDWKAAARQWKQKGWGLAQPNVGKAPFKRSAAPTEWERKTKMERIAALRAQIQEMRYPGGCAFAVALTGEKLLRAQLAQAEIETIQKELRVRDSATDESL